MRRMFVATSIFALTACGFNGTDRYKDEAAASSPQSAHRGADTMASNDPAKGQQSVPQIPDVEERPIMQAQVVLDRQGFTPGVVDGKMGMSTQNALKGFQQANSLKVTGTLDDATKQALSKWKNILATRVVTIPKSFADEVFCPTPDDPEDQAKFKRLGYQSLDEKLAERFHTTVDTLKTLNPDGRPSGMSGQTGASAMRGSSANVTSSPTSAVTDKPNATASPQKVEADPACGPDAKPSAKPFFAAGQKIRVPNIGADAIDPAAIKDRNWGTTLAALGVGTTQPSAAKIVVDKSDSTLKAFDKSGKLIALFTVTSGSSHDPLPLGDWKIVGVAHNPPFSYNPDLFWDVADGAEKQELPPGPNGPIGVVWIDLSKEHYGIHGTSAPETIGRAQSHGCVRLTNWDAARLAEMVSNSTKVVFQA